MCDILCCSFGKDSIASVILAHKYNINIDYIIYSEVMFNSDMNISGENPLHIEFINSVAIPLFECWGYKVIVLHSDIDYVTWFNTRVSRGLNKNKLRGYPIPKMCGIARDCKFKPVKQFIKSLNDPIINIYVGIASDENKRLKRLKAPYSSLLELFNVSELEAFNLCKSYDLLSPIYDFSFRGGCWFCPNCRIPELSFYKSNYPNLYNSLLALDTITNKARDNWNYNNTFEEINDKVKLYDSQLTIYDFI